MSRFSSYVVAWADPHAPVPGEPVMERFRAAAQSQGGALLACGGAHDVVETDSRRFPTRLAIAGFSEDEAAKTWVTLAENHLPDTALLIPGQAEPVEWPPKRAAEQLEWSQRPQPPADRLGWLVSMWLDVTDFDRSLTSSTTFKWTVERHEGAVLGSGVPVVLKGPSGPSATGLMTFPDPRPRGRGTPALNIGPTGTAPRHVSRHRHRYPHARSRPSDQCGGARVTIYRVTDRLHEQRTADVPCSQIVTTVAA